MTSSASERQPGQRGNAQPRTAQGNGKRPGGRHKPGHPPHPQGKGPRRGPRGPDPHQAAQPHGGMGGPRPKQAKRRRGRGKPNQNTQPGMVRDTRVGLLPPGADGRAPHMPVVTHKKRRTVAREGVPAWDDALPRDDES